MQNLQQLEPKTITYEQLREHFELDELEDELKKYIIKRYFSEKMVKKLIRLLRQNLRAVMPDIKRPQYQT
jgi:transcriptional regulator NrdR family protein